jgi:uncharacterized protein YjbI with pentapeptide repeats
LGVVILIASAVDKTLWNWLELLIVPAVIAGGGIWFNRQQQERQREDNRQQQERELDLAERRSQDEALQTYLDGMSQLLTDKDRPLHRARPGDSLSTVARARTLTVLTKLDGGRKGILLRFLYESGLLNKDTPVFTISGGDLSGADLTGAGLRDATLPPPLFGSGTPPHRGSTFVLLKLNGANLSGANLNNAKLVHVLLREANLSLAHLNDAVLEHTWLDKADMTSANLNYAKLTWCVLQRANLSGAQFNFADLRDAILVEANLDTASLIEADLSGSGSERSKPKSLRQ